MLPVVDLPWIPGDRGLTSRTSSRLTDSIEDISDLTSGRRGTLGRRALASLVRGRCGMSERHMGGAEQYAAASNFFTLILAWRKVLF